MQSFDGLMLHVTALDAISQLDLMLSMLYNHQQIGDAIERYNELMRESLNNIQKMASDDSYKIYHKRINQTGRHRYVYNWRWMGLPIIQLPADIAATQRLFGK